MLARSRKHRQKDEKVYELISLVAGDFSLQQVLDKLTEAAVKITAVKACAIRLLSHTTGDLKMRSTYGLSEAYRNRGVVSKEDAVIKAAFAGEAVVLDDMRVDGRVKHKKAAIKEGLVSQLTVALRFRGKPIGVLRLYSPKPKQFDADDIEFARGVASQCAAAITNAKLYARAIEGARITEQMRLAGVIQRRMIPEKAPLLPGLDVAGMYIPCFEIGGDFYDFFKINDNCIAIMIADVIGKGIPAAMMMSMFRGAIRAYADITGAAEEIKQIVYRLNKMACRECHDGEFISLFYAIINVARQSFTYCNCGHEPTLLIRKQRVISLDKGGLVLGVEQDTEYQIGKMQLDDGDSLLFYTDGLIDAMNFEGKIWGREQLIETAKGFIAGSARQMAKNILRYRRRFVGLARQIDDTSLVAVKFDRTAEPEFMKQVSY